MGELFVDSSVPEVGFFCEDSEVSALLFSIVLKITRVFNPLNQLHMNSRIKGSLRNQNGFAWVAGLMLVGAIALAGVFTQTASATQAPEPNECGESTTYTFSSGGQNGGDDSSKPANIDYINTQSQGSPDSLTVSADSGFEITKIEVSVDDDGQPGFTQIATGPITNVNPSGTTINVTKVTVKKVCPDVCENIDGDQYVVPQGMVLIGDQCVEPTPENTIELCSDQADNDYDQVTDMEDSDCEQFTPKLTVTKVVTNDSGTGQSVVENFALSVGDTAVTSGVQTTFSTGTYIVSETGPGGYSAAFSGDCSESGEVTLALGETKSCTLTNDDIPRQSIIVNTQKFVCADPLDLPNYGVGGGTDMSDELLAEWLGNTEDSCEPAEWNFQWVLDTASNTNPGDETEIAPEPWSEPFSVQETIPLASPARVWFREVFDIDYVGFSGATTTEEVGGSAEFYCHNDALNFDNWDWIDAVPGEEYNCIAWNVPLKSAEPNFCEDNLLVDGGFEEDEVIDAAMWQLFASIPGWMVAWVNPSEATPMFELQEGVNGWLAFEGDQYIELDSDRPDTNANTKIWQDIATNDDVTYKLTYQFSPRPGTLSADNTVGVYWNGALVDTVSGDNNTGNTVWTEEMVSGLEADDATGTLEFRSVGTSNEYGAFVDAVCLVEVPKQTCVLDIVSDTTSIVDETDDEAVATFMHAGWTANIPGATWIWKSALVENPTQDETYTFTKTFLWGGDESDIVSAVLDVAADNSYKIWVNETLINEDNTENNFGTADALGDISSELVYGVNEIKIEVKNWALADSTAESNPAGALYKLAIVGEGNSCTEEPAECADGIDNDKDGNVDYPDDLGCDDPTDDDEDGEPELPEYGPYCGDGIVDESWEQCDPGLVSRDSISIDNESSCNQYCQFDNQCSDLVVARINTDNLVNTGEEYGADMTEDVWLGGDDEGVNNIPGWAWFPVYYNGSAVDDLDFGNYDNVEDVPGYAVNRDEDMIRVRMHGDHPAQEIAIREHAEGSIEIRHAFTDTSVLTAMKNQLAGNAMEFPFNGTTGSVTNPGNDELNLGGLGNFWMVVGPEDDGFRAEYVVGEELSCENPSDEGTVTGYKFEDLNADGDWDEGEEGLAGWTINAYAVDFEGDEPILTLVESEVTDESGAYNFSLPEGLYGICEENQAGWTQTKPSNISGDTLYYGNCYSHSVTQEAPYTGSNFGNHYNEETPETPDEPNNNTSRSNSRRGGSSSNGRVLGATTEGFCPFLKDYLHINMQNNPTEVNKAKAFFNSYLGKALILDGVFDKDMFAAAVEFQNMFSGDVLDTWVEEFAFLDDNATGYIYQTTKWKINSILCPGYEAFPDELIVANGTTVAY